MAPFTLTVRDERTTGKELATLDLQLEAEQVTVAELIRARVHQEVRAHNAAFERGQILLLVDDRQVEELDHRVTLQPGSTVTFLKLVPLVGG